MNQDQFWKLIDESRIKADGDPDEQIEVLQNLINELPEDEIVAFDTIFSGYHAKAYTWDLWGAAYIIGGGCSDDSFMDFRGWLISRGKSVYDSALKEPDFLSTILTEDDDCQIEGFQYIPAIAWEEKTGRSSDDYPHPDIKSPIEPLGKKWDEDDLETKFPKLSKKFN